MRRKINKMVDHMQAELEIAPRDMMEIRMSCSILRPSQQVLDLFLMLLLRLIEVSPM